MSAQPRLLVTGTTGQLVRSLQAAGLTGGEVVYTDRSMLDLSKPAELADALDALRPRLVVNAAAYTAVDKAEQDSALATTVNGEAPGEIARWCAGNGASMIQVSTDYVFDGCKQDAYKPGDPVQPLGAYGRSKALGEERVRAALDRHVIVRMAWVYSPYGHNFLKTMLRLAAERDELGIVDDQRGTPSYGPDLASGLMRIVAGLDGGIAPWGTYHLTNRGETTWYGFAAEIFRLAAAAGHKVPRLNAIATSDYPTPAARPANSVLDCSATEERFGVALPDWQDGVARCMDVLGRGQGSGERNEGQQQP